MRNIRKQKNDQPILKIDATGLKAFEGMGPIENVEINWEDVKAIYCYTYRHGATKRSEGYLIIQLDEDERFASSLSDKDKLKMLKGFKLTAGSVVLDLRRVEQKQVFENLFNRLRDMRTFDDLFDTIEIEVGKHSGLPLIRLGHLPGMMSDYVKIIEKHDANETASSDVMKIRNAVTTKTNALSWGIAAALIIGCFALVAFENSTDGKSSTTDAKSDAGGRFKGDVVAGQRTGKGVMTWPNGNRYEGDFIAGVRTGKGVFTWADGDRYEGDFVGNERTGKGVYTWEDGGRYEGDMVGGKFTGKGIRTWPSGDRHEGDFINDERTGKGVYTWANGNRHEGDFVEGVRTGKGVFTWADGDRYEGDFVGNERTGKGVYTWEDGGRYEGVIIGRTNLPIVNRGDALFHVARVDDLEDAESTIECRAEIAGKDPLFDGIEIV